MTTIAQLEMLLSTLPSDIVDRIHDYAKHPIAEIFKAAEDEIRDKRFPTAARSIMGCYDAFEKKDEDLFFDNRSDFYTWYNSGVRDTFTESDRRYFCITNFEITCMRDDLGYFFHEQFIYRITSISRQLNHDTRTI